ncbi:hypothetical protein L218DRAFT_924853 [Marasmius fiardii PR-910]|nr:hypothetical protein L218DRAFT_924853 [Marasmius fiardii PR-910]
MSVQLRILGVPSAQLRLESLKVYSRLRRILEFKHWLEYTQAYCHRKEEPPYKLLFDCFALGASLGILLDLLGSPAPNHLNVDVETFDFIGVSLAEREKFFSSFLHRIQLLEVQGKLPFGEVLRPEDFFGGSSSGFMKVLKTVSRILDSLHASYPGLFSVPNGYQTMRRERVQELIETERVHVSFLSMIVNSTAALSSGSKSLERALEGLVINNTRLRQYHDRVLQELESLTAGQWLEQWEQIFGFHDHATRTNIATCYRSACVNYISLHDFLYEQVDQTEPVLAGHAQILLDVLCHIPSRISDYLFKLRNILALSLPTPPAPNTYPLNPFDSLCTTIFHLEEIFSTVDEISRQLRTVHATQIIRRRAFHWPNSVDPDDLGNLLLDDALENKESGVIYDVFLFEAMLLCCSKGSKSSRQAEPRDAANEYAPVYPIRSWVFGPALRKSLPLNLEYAIPTRNLRLLRIFGSDGFDVEWSDENGRSHILEFISSYESQHEQWCSLLQLFASTTVHEEDSESESDSLDEQVEIALPDDMIFSEDECVNGRRRTRPRPWSLIARKGPRSETSSVMRQAFNESEALLSPTLLPSLFNNALSLNDVEPLDPEPPAPFGFTPSSEASFLDDPELLAIPDLTGKVTRDGRFPEAHGGFADVWKGTWHDGCHEVKVAVKVLRSRLGTPEMEEKMKKRLEKELRVWKKLDHPNVVALYGTVSDFGPYESMVCPWLDNGTVSHYMERCGDILSMTDRLRLLCEVAEGLEYLHSFGIVHGDLTGCNVLVDSEGRASLGDFGLSGLMADFHEGHFSSNFGGAVRWADASFYRLDYEEDQMPKLSTHSDIYSLGSVILEILSGRIPYHYVRSDAQVVIELHKGNKPRRPAPSFVTDSQWVLIVKCWADVPKERPSVKQALQELQVLHRASLEFRRHTA